MARAPAPAFLERGIVQHLVGLHRQRTAAGRQQRQASAERPPPEPGIIPQAPLWRLCRGRARPCGHAEAPVLRLSKPPSAIRIAAAQIQLAKGLI